MINNLHHSVFAQRHGVSLLENLVAYYSFDANNANDIHTGKNGTLVGSPTFQAGKNGNAINFGNNTALNYVDIADNDDFSFTTGSADVPFSISLWVNPVNLFNSGVNFGLIVKRNVNFAEWQLTLLTDNYRVQLAKFDNGAPSSFLAIRSNNPLTINNWQHIICTDNGNASLSGMKMYINRVLQTGETVSVGTYTKMNNTSSSVRVGLSQETTQVAKLRGTIDEIAIWKNRELTQTEVTALYNGGAGKFYNTF